MKKRPRIPPKALRDVWDRVPKMVDCKGLCFDSCGPIPISSLERELLEERTGKPVYAVGRSMTCSLLQDNGLCSAYSIRPLVCRLWGAVEGLPCVHGCKPERMLSSQEALELFNEVEQIAGDTARSAMIDMIASMTPEQRRHWEKTHDAEVKAQVRRIIKSQRESEDD